jgi:hypothetical protein
MRAASNVKVTYFLFLEFSIEYFQSEMTAGTETMESQIVEKRLNNCSSL